MLEIKEQILLGGLLGDASVSKLKKGVKTCSIRWEHSLAQKEYAIWKAENSLDNYSIYIRKRFDKRTDKIYESITCYSIKDDYFVYRKLFYSDIKHISIDILNKLKPLGIAVWYMDDGSIYYNGNNCHLSLAIDGFLDDERLMIVNYFKDEFNLDFKINRKSIRLVSKKECEKFMLIIDDLIPECMAYKKLTNAIIKHKLKPKKDRKKIIGRNIIQLDKNGVVLTEWKSVSEASNYLGISENSIYCNLSGKSKYCNNSKWLYK